MKASITSMKGASLIEVLVTMVILGIGLLGLAGLQVTNIKNAQNAYYRSQATFLAYDILDRMRVNRAASADYAVGAGIPTAGSSIASKDLNEWKTALSNDLPDGEGALSISGDLVTVRVEWDDRRASSQAGDPCYVSGARKACFVTQAGM